MQAQTEACQIQTRHTHTCRQAQTGLQCIVETGQQRGETCDFVRFLWVKTRCFAARGRHSRYKGRYLGKHCVF
jgi:hypothetical protein